MNTLFGIVIKWEKCKLPDAELKQLEQEVCEIEGPDDDAVQLRIGLPVIFSWP